MNHSTICKAAMVVIGCCVFALVQAKNVMVAGSPVQEDVVQQWMSDYADLETRLMNLRTEGRLSKKGNLQFKAMDENALLFESDKCPLDVVLRRTGALLKSIQGMRGAQDMPQDMRAYAAHLAAIRRTSAASALAKTAAGPSPLYLEACALRRQIALANPLVDFTKMLYTVEGNNYANMMNQQRGFSATPCGGIYLVSNFGTAQANVKDLLASSIVESGRYKGQKLAGRGAFTHCDLSYDGTQVLFSWVENPVYLGVEYKDSNNYTPATSFHVFKVNVDGSHLIQLTDGKWNDCGAIWVPGGRIVFLSDRRWTVARCDGNGGPRFTPASVMYSMKADGADFIQISWHETDELYPCVDNDGKLVYTRWDYIDRDFDMHSFWTCFPDGRDPRSPHGNYPQPHTTLTGSNWVNGRTKKPLNEMTFRPIPGSKKLIGIACGHHDYPWGPPFILDIQVPDDDVMSQVTPIKPPCCFPQEEAASVLPAGCTVGLGSAGYGGSNMTDDNCRYWSPWPLSEDYYLVTKGLDIILMDKFGNEEKLHTATVQKYGKFNDTMPAEWYYLYDHPTARYATPLRPRYSPPALTPMTWQGERKGTAGHYRATISILNVNEADFTWPAGTKIRALRIIQIIPKAAQAPALDIPKMGYSDGGIGRMVLGTVPVESDGSCYFEAPVGKEIYFQTLDSLGMAVQSMRSGTFVHPGEQMSCVGCHENKWKAVQPGPTPIAFKRPPSKITPDVPGSCPLTFSRLVQPLFQSKCLTCHQKEQKGILNFSYGNLEPYAFYFNASDPQYFMKADHGGSRTIAGMFGAKQSKMGKTLLATHFPSRITASELHRATLWLDCNSMELAAYWGKSGIQAAVDAQRAGVKPVWPTNDVDSTNPTGVENDRPVTGTMEIIRHLRGRGLIATPGVAGGRLIGIRAGDLTLVNNALDPAAVSVFDLRGRMVFCASIDALASCDLGAKGLRRGTYIVHAVFGSAGTIMRISTVNRQ